VIEEGGWMVKAYMNIEDVVAMMKKEGPPGP
jgi:hypothetical protein